MSSRRAKLITAQAAEKDMGMGGADGQAGRANGESAQQPRKAPDDCEDPERHTDGHDRL